MEITEKLRTSKTTKKIDAFVKNNRLSHAYFIVGESSFSLQHFVNFFATRLICDTQNNCAVCANCQKIANGFHPDVLVYPKGKNFVVSDSDDIISNVQIKPFEARYKVVIINRLDISTVQAQNKILKTIEESPQNVIFLITAVNTNAVLPTIKSRAQILEIENFEDKTENQKAMREFLIDMLLNMTTSAKIIDYVTQFSEKTQFKSRLVCLGEVFDEILHAQNSKSHDAKILQLAKHFNAPATAKVFALLTTALKQFEANVNTNIIADILLFKILEVKYLWNKSK